MGQRPSIQRTRKYRSHHGYVKNINRVRGELSQGSKKCQLIFGNLLESLFQENQVVKRELAEEQHRDPVVV